MPIPKKRIDRSHAEVLEIFHDTKHALCGSCSRFDKGDTREYRAMSNVIRQLCRDTGMSKSILSQLNLKERNYVTSVYEPSNSNRLDECQLIELVIRPKLVNKSAYWRAVLDRVPMEFVDFDTWWEGPVLRQANGTTFSRSDLVGFVADQDGGVHTDPQINEAFQQMRKNSFQMTDGRSITEHPDRHAIRQISHELIKSLLPSYRRLHKTVGTAVISRGLSAVGTPGSHTKELLGYHSTSGSEGCPCGSGIIYKQCHRIGAQIPSAAEIINHETVAPPDAAFMRVGLGFRYDVNGD